MKVVFIKKIGKSNDDMNVYEFMFSDDIESVWGLDWEVKPANICNIQTLDKDMYKKKYILKSNIDLFLIQKNNCFSMQDCIDGIVPLCWEDISEYEEYPDNGRLVIHFGKPIEEVNYLLSLKGLKLELDSYNI